MIRWLNIDHVKWIHYQQLKEYGGLGGIRDLGILESCINAPPNRNIYEGIINLGVLSATYVTKIIRNHPFVDGNKRTGIVAVGVFLSLNNYELDSSEEDLYSFVYGFAEHKLASDDFTTWVCDHIKPLT